MRGQVFFHIADVVSRARSRGLALTPATARLHADLGRLRCAGRATRGDRLFVPRDVDAYIATELTSRVDQAENVQAAELANVSA